MYMAIIPTYIVEYTDIHGEASWRVSKDDLKTFLSILMYNDVDDFKVKKEHLCS